jgi:hypothetical protein
MTSYETPAVGWATARAERAAGEPPATAESYFLAELLASEDGSSAASGEPHAERRAPPR